MLDIVHTFRTVVRGVWRSFSAPSHHRIGSPTAQLTKEITDEVLLQPGSQARFPRRPASVGVPGICTSVSLLALAGSSWPLRGDRVRGLRLTFAGQAVVVIVAALVVFVLALAVVRVASPSAAPAATVATVTVERGQTLSQLAATHLPQPSIAEGVAQLRLANGLNSSNIEAGQRLVIPAIG